MYDIARPAKVCDHRDGAGRESFKDHACTKIPNRWKYHHICGSQPREDLHMASPTTEGDSPLDTKGSHKLLEAVPVQSVADHGKAGQIASQKGGSRAQPEITSFAGDEPTDKD